LLGIASDWSLWRLRRITQPSAACWPRRAVQTGRGDYPQSVQIGLDGWQTNDSLALMNQARRQNSPFYPLRERFTRLARYFLHGCFADDASLT
jgi:hypothetical protein